MAYAFLIFIILFTFTCSANSIENCKWNNKKGNPCITINKTSNSSSYNAQGINKKLFTKKQITEDSGYKP